MHKFSSFGGMPRKKKAQKDSEAQSAKKQPTMDTFLASKQSVPVEQPGNSGNIHDLKFVTIEESSKQKKAKKAKTEDAPTGDVALGDEMPENADKSDLRATADAETSLTSDSKKRKIIVTAPKNAGIVCTSYSISRFFFVNLIVYVAVVGSLSASSLPGNAERAESTSVALTLPADAADAGSSTIILANRSASLTSTTFVGSSEKKQLDEASADLVLTVGLKIYAFYQPATIISVHHNNASCNVQHDDGSIIENVPRYAIMTAAQLERGKIAFASWRDNTKSKPPKSS